jgi:serine/threonine protein kinase
MLKDLDAYDAFPADVWSLAATTFFATTGTGFAPNAAENPKDILPCLAEVQRNISVNTHISEYLKNLLTGMTDMIPAKRLTIEQVSKHEWFTVPESELVPKPAAAATAATPPGQDPTRARSKKIVTPAHALAASAGQTAAAVPAGNQTKTSATPAAPVDAGTQHKNPAGPAAPTDAKASPKPGHKSQPTPAAAPEVPPIPKAKSLPAADNPPPKAVKAVTVPLIKLEKKKSPDDVHKQNAEAKNEKTSKSQPTPQTPTKSKSSESAKGAHGKDVGKDGKKTKSV